ncbi:type II CRISPR RNA-guided endonuclease Cas9 [Companilactobacillus sp. DQM5]|uniref:type II CRISPR RNA-guided endonuclease Cas9 n=1 Tax=Companilactobacillus sp. DQM5 TaxID=3463359 RepID=UPI0040581F6E
MTKNISLGLDIGVSSVGFSVIDADKGKILELGVRLFNASVSAENQTRRDRRGTRRLTNRKQQRRRDVTRLFEDVGLITKNDKYDRTDKRYEYYKEYNNSLNPYELRVRGLNEKLTKKEIAKALYHIVKRRGISFDLRDADADFGGNDYSSSLQKNNIELKEKYPAEIQLSRLENLHKVRGIVTDSENEDNLLNVFPTKAFVSEAKKIIETQRKYYPEVITEEFEEKYLEILTRKRDYFVGPGSEKSRTNYGIYREDGKTLDNLFEELIGHDKVFPDQLRASGASYTAQVFNVLNDLNNLTIANHEDGKLTTDEKEKIIEELKTTTKTVQMIKLIKKIANCEEDDIKGYRKDPKTDKPDIHSMNIYRKVHKLFFKNDIDVTKWPIEFWDKLSFILTLNTENGEIRKQLENRLTPEFKFLDDQLIQFIIDNKSSFDITSNKKWHRFSLKTMNKLIPEMIQNPVEQMTALSNLGLLKHDGMDFSSYKYLPYNKLTNEIFNPVVAKSVREALKIVNEVMKKYGSIEYLIVEMPRDKNADEEKKNIADRQKENAKRKDAAMVAFYDDANSSSLVDKALKEYRGKMNMMIRLWYEQDGHSYYSGKKITADEIISNPGNFEIDHIIPQSISFDDSFNNKTLCYKSENQEKGQMTPYESMNNGNGQSFEQLKAMVLKNSKIGPGKRANYLFDENVSDIDVRKRFIARNLVDTSYASRVVLNNLQDFFTQKQKETKISVVRGKFTSNLRSRWKINKTRDTYHHHAVDASIIASTPFLNVWKKSNSSIIPTTVKENVVDVETGEILDKKEFEYGLYEEPYKGFFNDIKNSEDRIKFSHQVDKKINRKISDETIYSTRKTQLSKDKEEADYVISKIKDIYTVDGYEKFKKVYEKDPEKFLMSKIDPKTFEKIEKIYKEYPNTVETQDQSGKVKTVSVSPFELYKQKHGLIKKSEKGPFVKQLKYYDKKLGSHVDITPNNARNKKVVLQSLNPWRTDVYFNHETNEYEIMGIKYADLKFYDKGNYGINREKYNSIKESEGISKDSEFMFTLYKKDRIKALNIDFGEQIEMLHWSRSTNNKGYVELKPIDSQANLREEWPIYGKNRVEKQIIKRLAPKGCKIWKVNTDVLGNPFYIEKEGDFPKDIID